MSRAEGILKDCARKCGNRPILVSGDVNLSCSDFDALSDRLAAALVGQGIGPGESVAVFLDNSFEAVAAIFAVLKMGGVVCPIDSLWRADEVAAVLNGAGAACLFTESRLAATAAVAMAQAPALRLTIVSGTEGSPAIDGILRFEDAAGTEPGAAADGAGGDVAVHFYTPGSARVTLTHGELLAAVEDLGEAVGEDAMLPLSTEAGFVGLLAALHSGATLRIARPFALPEAVGAALLGEKPAAEEAEVFDRFGRRISAGRG